jgi:hypothetical protein
MLNKFYLLLFITKAGVVRCLFHLSFSLVKSSRHMRTRGDETDLENFEERRKEPRTLK